MQTILCFGDSNTWGLKPGIGERFALGERWPGVLGQELGKNYHIVEEGLHGRTTLWDDPNLAFRNGKDYLIPCLDSHAPIDLVIFLLGTNDLKKQLHLSARDIANAAGVLVDIAQRSQAGPYGDAPSVLLLAPPPIRKDLGSDFEDAIERSNQFSQEYQRVASEQGCRFFDTAEVATFSEIDGIHFNREEHIKLGQSLAALVKTISNAEN